MELGAAIIIAVPLWLIAGILTDILKVLRR